MAFVHGKNTAVVMNGYNLSGYLQEAEIEDATESLENTCFGATAKGFQGGLDDGSFSASGLFDGTVGAVDEVLMAAKGVSGTLFTFAPAGLGTAGLPVKIFKALNTSYNASSSVGELVAVSVEAVSDAGMFSASLLAPLASQVASTVNSATVDSAALSARGYVAQLHVTAIASGNLIAKVQHSVDGTTWADLVTFTTATAIGAQQAIATTGTVNRYIRAVGTSTGTVTYTIALSRR